MGLAENEAISISHTGKNTEEFNLIKYLPYICKWGMDVIRQVSFHNDSPLVSCTCMTLWCVIMIYIIYSKKIMSISLNNLRGRKLLFLFLLGYLFAQSQKTSFGFGDTWSRTYNKVISVYFYRYITIATRKINDCRTWNCLQKPVIPSMFLSAFLSLSWVLWRSEAGIWVSPHISVSRTASWIKAYWSCNW